MLPFSWEESKKKKKIVRLTNSKNFQLQDKLQHVIKYFYKAITAHPLFEEAVDAGILAIPNVEEDWEDAPFLSHISYLITRQRYNLWLYFHLQLAGFIVLPIAYPVVPKGKSRVRIVFHARHTEEQLDALVNAICDWAQEMLDIEASGKGRNMIPTAARKVYAARANGSSTDLESR